MASRNQIFASQFAAQMSRFSERFGESVRRTVQEAAYAGVSAVIDATPVDTGLARSNWRVGINTEPTGVISPHAPGKNLGVGETVNANAAKFSALEQIARFKLGDRIFIINNAPHIQFLNAGSSAQAPANFIDRALLRAQAAAVRVRLA